MPHGKEKAAFDINLPLHNSNEMKCIAVIAVTDAAAVQDLSSLFSNLDTPDFLTLIADGTKIYIAFAGTDATSIDRTSTGTNNAACWPIPDGTYISGNLPSGREVYTNLGATLTNFYRLHHRAASGTSGFLRVYRSSHQDHDVGRNFKRP